MTRNLGRSTHKVIGSILWESIIVWIAISTFVKDLKSNESFTNPQIYRNLCLFLIVGIATLLIEISGLTSYSQKAMKVAAFVSVLGTFVSIGPIVFQAIQFGLHQKHGDIVWGVILLYPILLLLGIWAHFTLWRMSDDGKAWKKSIGRSVIAAGWEMLNILFAILVIARLGPILKMLIALLCIAWIFELLGDDSTEIDLFSRSFILKSASVVGSGMLLLSSSWALGYGAALYLLASRVMIGINLYNLSCSENEEFRRLSNHQLNHDFKTQLLEMAVEENESHRDLKTEEEAILKPETS